jgi:hypothetical protein
MWATFFVPFFESIMEGEMIYGCFMQGGAVAHTTDYFINVLNKVFRDTDKSQIVICKVFRLKSV